MVNYTNSKIYKIFSNNSTKIYVGSTTKPYLSTRLAQHVSQFRKSKTNERVQIFPASFLVIEDGDYHIELLEIFSCNSRDELSVREGYWKQQFKDCLVSRIINKLEVEDVKTQMTPLPTVKPIRGRPPLKKIPAVPEIKYRKPAHGIVMKDFIKYLLVKLTPIHYEGGRYRPFLLYDWQNRFVALWQYEKKVRDYDTDRDEYECNEVY